MKKRTKDFYYTNEKMVKDLISLIPAKREDTFLDAGSGKNKVWFNNLNVAQKFECEIEDSCDFYKWDKKVDWVVGNPPFRDKKEGTNQIPLWVEKASEIANKGMAFLVNHKIINFLTTSRLEKLKQKGFEITKWHIVSDKRWYGRYYFIIFEKGKKGIIGWEIKSY